VTEITDWRFDGQNRSAPKKQNPAATTFESVHGKWSTSWEPKKCAGGHCRGNAGL